MDGPPPPDEDFSTIPLLDRIAHKNWKARLDGYEALPKLFQLTSSDSDPAFRPYLNDPALLKKIASDSNAVAQEKGLDALCALVQYSGENSAKTRDTIVPILVDKCLGSSRAGTKAKAVELILRYIEVDNGGEATVRDVLPGLGAKQPKAVAATVMALNEAFKAFGIKVIPPKETLKALPKIFGHSDKTVRAEGTALTQTLYSFLGQGIQPFMAELKPVQVKELNESFAKMDEANGGPNVAKTTRFTRAQQREREAAEMAGVEPEGEEDAPEETTDPRLLLDEVDILPKIPADFHALIGSSKWKERKEVLDRTLEVVNANPRIKDADGYGELTKALGKRMTDANIQCVIAAAQIIEGLSKGIGQPFGKYKAAIVSPMFERFKERKQNVVDAIGQGLDAFVETITLSDITEDIFTALKSKNPQVKEGTVKFLTRALSTTKVPPAKGDIKPMSELLVTLLEDGYEPVRAASADGLGALMKIVGERQLNSVIDPLDDIRKAKVKESFDKATVRCRAGAAPSKPATQPSKSAPTSKSKLTSATDLDVDATPRTKPSARLLAKKAPGLPMTEEEGLPEGSESPRNALSARLTKKAPTDENMDPDAPPGRNQAKKPVASAAPAPKKLAVVATAAGKSMPKAGSAAPSEAVKYKMSPEDADAQASTVIPDQLRADLGDANWKVRLTAMDGFLAWLESGSIESEECEMIFRFLAKKPGWGEKNFQVSAKVYAAMVVLAEKSPSFGRSCVALAIAHLSDKLGDIKLKKPAGDTLISFAENTSLAFVLDQVYEPLSKQKAPKVLGDAIAWITQALSEFGIIGLSLRNLVDFLKGSLKNSNAAVRSSATSTLVTLRLFAGPSIRDLLEDLNPQLLTTIEAEFAKVESQSPPLPSRVSRDVTTAGPSVSGKGKSGDPLDELFPRVDLDRLVGGTTILADSKSDAWKTRKEALEKLQSLLDSGANKRLKPNMGDIGQVLKARLADSNKAVQILALDVVARIAAAMNKPFEKHARVLVRPVADVLADQKANIRTSAMVTLSAIANACEGLDAMVNPLATALESANPQLRSSLLSWMADWIDSHPVSSLLDLSPWAGPVVAALDDRSGEVRKAGQALLPFVISSAGFDFVLDKTQSLKPASRASVIPIIQGARSSQASIKTGAPSTKSVAPPTQAGISKVASAASEVVSVDVPAIKRAPGNLRLRKIESISRPASRADSVTETPISAGPSGTMQIPTRPSSSASASHPLPFTSGNVEIKRMRLSKDPSRWIVEGLPIRKDLVEALQHQMEPFASRDLLHLLFGKDHNAVSDSVKGLGMLEDAYSRAPSLDDPAKSLLTANSDLCFKYVSLKIHEPQSNLVTRCLDVLDSIIAFLTQEDYTVGEQEALCFVPTVVNKLGDSREPVRLRVQNLIHNLAKVHPASRLFQLLLEYGSKSKVAKTRQGALDEMASILKRVGINACEPSKAFPTIGSMIGDKDPGVRKAALGVLSEAFVLVGDQVWRCVGTLPPKDKTQLEERLKRITGSPVKVDDSDVPAVSQISRIANGSAARAISPGPGSRLSPAPRPASPARSMGSTALPNAADSMPSPGATGRPRSFLPSRLGPPRAKALVTKIEAAPEPEPSSSPKPSVAHSKDHPSPIAGPSSTTDKDVMEDGISITISSILSSDTARSVEALKKIQKILESPSNDDTSPAFKELADHTEGLIETVTLQMSHVFDRGAEVAEAGNFRLAKHLIQTLNSFCDHNVLAESLTVEILTSLLEELTTRLLQTDESEDPKVKDLSRFINMIVLRIFATGRRISIFRALFALLLQITRPFPANGTNIGSKDAKLAELVLKCVWKMARSLPQELAKGTLDAVELFPAIEQFLQSIPPNEWRQRAQNKIPVGDMPLRTIKVIIQHIVGHAPDQVYDQLSEAFDDPSATIVYPYVYRILNSAPGRPAPEERAKNSSGSAVPLSVAETIRSGSPSSSRQASPPPDSRSRVPSEGTDSAPQRAIKTGTPTRSPQGLGIAYGYSESSEPDPDDRLIEIIDHISSETTGAMHKEGITELHHFLKEYPHKKPKVDKLLDATGTAFRKYIARALASRAAEDEEREVAVADTLHKLEHKRHASNALEKSQSASPKRDSGIGMDRRFSSHSEAPVEEDKALSRLHDIFKYQGRSSISSQRNSLSPQPEV